MNIEKGWVFYTSDFSLVASGMGPKGTVMLRRDSENYALWHKMSYEDKEDDDGPPLYVVGFGETFEEALISANLVASHALPIKKVEK